MMNSTRIKAVFFDVDGTLLSFADHTVPPSTRAALDALRGEGVRIVIATGRSAANLAEIAALPYDGVIGLNGTDCRLRAGDVVSRDVISPESFRRVMELADRYDFAVSVEGNSGVFVSRLTPRVCEMARMIAHPAPEVRNLWEVYDAEETSQLCLFTDPETEREVMAQLPELQSSRWCDVFADVNVAGKDKATGMEVFMRHFGITREETMAFGDGGNDMPMLRAAGIGVAMGNASEEVKACADFVTRTVEEGGIAYALIRFGVIRPTFL